MEKRYMDVRLMGAVRNSIGFPEVPYDLKKVKKLDNFTYARYWAQGDNPRQWLGLRDGAFDLIGEMSNLHTLLFPENCKIFVEDFSFLGKCLKLKKLDLGWTNFTDCSLLTNLPSLRWVRLPKREGLIHTEALEKLSASVSFSPQMPAEPIPQPVAEPAKLVRQKSAKSRPEKQIEALAEAIKRLTGEKAYRLTIQPDVKPGLLDSKFGGIPYWDMAKPYPTDMDGMPMCLLAQINFDRTPAGEPLPKGGMLQFFITPNEVYGASFGADRQDFMVVYHRHIDENVTAAQVCALADIDNEPEDWPLWGVFAVKVEENLSYMNEFDSRFDAVFCQAVKEVLGEEVQGEDWFDFLDDDDYVLLKGMLQGDMNGGHWMLGYPGFTQEDPRDGGSPYDTLLLQIDSALDADKRDYLILWGDCGVGNFFINHEDLKNCDFSRVFYTWDCC